MHELNLCDMSTYCPLCGLAYLNERDSCMACHTCVFFYFQGNYSGPMFDMDGSPCLHVRDIHWQTFGSNRAPHSYMSIFSLDKGEKEHAVFVNANRGWGCLNSYFQTGNYSGPMFDMDGSSCLHVRDIHWQTLGRIGLPTPI